MHIDSSPDDKYLQTLTLGSFPRKVVQYQSSLEFMRQSIYVDYSLQQLIQREFRAETLTPSRHFVDRDKNLAPHEKLQEILNYAKSVSTSYRPEAQSTEANLYFTTVLAHLYYLDSDLDAMHLALNSVPFSIDMASSSGSPVKNEFLQYLACRYYVLLGLTNVGNSYKLWNEYLFYYSKPFQQSNVAGKHWLGLLFQNLAKFIAGSREVSFSDLKEQKFGENNLAMISFGGYLIRNKHLIGPSFKQDFADYLFGILERKMNAELHFPDASATDASEDHFVDNLCLAVSGTLSRNPVVKTSVLKKVLVKSMSLTYQSRIVLASYIEVLLSTGEYDEASSVLNTYKIYIKNHQEIHGFIDNILLVIRVLTECLINFNPIRSFNGSNTKFKHVKRAAVNDILAETASDLTQYLNILSKITGMSFDSSALQLTLDKIHLSFLFHKYNPNVLQSDTSEFVSIVSKGWSAVGFYYSYLATYDSPTKDLLEANVSNILFYYKRSLIVNLTGDSELLFSYALSLAHAGFLDPALKLCKFILKKYPESFETWNLLVLIQTALESKNPDAPVKRKTENGSEHNGNDHANRELEKLINNALNVAGIYMGKHRNNPHKFGFTVKHNILQLKLTQIAVWESIYGTHYVMEYLHDVFVFFHELFDVKVAPKGVEPVSSPAKDTAKWSHRPSVIDPQDHSLDNTEAQADGSNGLTLSRTKSNRLSRRFSRLAAKPVEEITNGVSKLNTENGHSKLDSQESHFLQEIWIWAFKMYFKVGQFEEAEQCIIEAENAYGQNYNTHACLGLLTSKERKFLSLQEFEKALEEVEDKKNSFQKSAYGWALLGLCKLFVIDDEPNNSLFISDKDKNAGLIRLKNYLEDYARCWPFGYNSPEVWLYLSLIYEKVDDKILYAKSLWRTVELEDFRPVRGYDVCSPYK